MNTIFLSIVAILVITGIMTTCYAWGYAEGREKGIAESDIDNCRVVVQKIIKNLEEHGDEFIDTVCYKGEDSNGKHVITHADLAKMEQEARNKQEQ
jgi:hypothetical protein